MDDRAKDRAMAKVRRKHVEKAQAGDPDAGERMVWAATADLGVLLEGSNLTESQKVTLGYLHDGLVQHRDGIPLERALGVERLGGRRKSQNVVTDSQRFDEVAQRLSQGVSVADAIELVAEAGGVSRSTIKQSWLKAGGRKRYLAARAQEGKTK